MEIKKNILICPLDWGLGHATRCIPIIKELLKFDNTKLIIAADKRPLDLLKSEFPDLEFVRFPGYKITYSKKGNLIIKMLSLLPSIFLGIYKEHQTLKTIINNHKIDIVISDNRFGLWNKNVYSIFMTHQIMIKLPIFLGFLEPLLYRINKLFINKYNECWIPDFDGTNNISGDLSHKYNLPANSYFIGPLSRFNNKKANGDYKYNVTAIISGPEPQRTIFEELIINQLKRTSLKSAIVSGKTEETKKEHQLSENIKQYSSLNQDELLKIIQDSEIIICRSGYSSIMDLATLGKKAVFVPTPGQTEQEYLAKYHKIKEYFYYTAQNKFDIIKSLKKAEQYYIEGFVNDYKALNKRIEFIINR